MIFSEKLQIIRKSKGMTQEKLAENLNVSLSCHGGLFGQALRKADKVMPYRGPEYYQSGEYTYKCNVVGDFHWFQGHEEIYRSGEKVYECCFHGGITK